MPNFDGGHYFLTVLAPIESARLHERHGVKSSAVHVVRDVLATLPTALQSPATEGIGLNSPFSRAQRTHLARFAVIDDVIYNGRSRRDALKVAALGPNPVIAEVEDKLTCPFLLFVADFDATSDNSQELRSYLAELWSTMEAELRLVFGHCVGFDNVTNAVSFQDYIMRCQVETTMPFNDYWITPPPLTSLKSMLNRTLAGSRRDRCVALRGARGERLVLGGSGVAGAGRAAGLTGHPLCNRHGARTKAFPHGAEFVSAIDSEGTVPST